MTQANDSDLTIEVKHTGERLTLRRVKNASGVEELHLSGTLPPHRQGPPLHVHFAEDEHGEVISGVLSALLDNKRLQVEAGGRARFPKGSAHRWWNDGDKELVFQGVATPAVDLDQYLQALFEVINAGSERRPPMFYMAHVLHRHRRAICLGLVGLALAFLTQPSNAQTFNYPDFSSASLAANPLKINGNAAAPISGVGGGPVLRLTPAALNQAGSAFNLNAVQLGSSGSFSTAFAFQLTSGGGSFSDGNQPPAPPGADGIVFVLNVTTNNVGALGQGVGYQGIPNSIGIKFDTWQDGVANGFPQDSDPTGNFVAIYTNGSTQTAGYVPYSPSNPGTTPQYYVPPAFMKNGDIWYVWIDYDGVEHRLDVRLLDTVNARPASPQLSETIDLGNTNLLGSSPRVFAGFTSATGAQYNAHDILFWEFNASYNPIGIPQLNIARSNNAVKIYWQSGLTNFQLQVNTNLSTTNWMTPPQTVSDDGTNKFILVDPPAGSAFYRLSYP